MKANMSEGRPGLRPWLIGQVNNGCIEGLRWLNEDKTKFQIPWKHKGKQEWNEEMGRIFREYEKHAGRYRDGDVKPFNFYTDSKQRLRSALGKSADFSYMDDKDQPDVRIYRVVQRTPAKPSICEHPTYPFSKRQRLNSLPVREPLIPASVTEFTVLSGGEAPEAPLSSDLENIHTSDMLLVAPAGEPMVISIDSEIDNMLSKSLGSMEISEDRAARNVHFTRKILMENGDCSVVICDKTLLGEGLVFTPPLSEGWDIQVPPVKGLDNQVPPVEGSVISCIGEASQYEFLYQHVKSQVYQCDIPSFPDVSAAAIFHHEQPAAEVQNDEDAWTNEYNTGENYNTDYIDSATTDYEYPRVASNITAVESADHTESIECSSDLERLCKELLSGISTYGQ